MWKAAGLADQAPKTFDELRDAAKKLTKTDAGGKITVAGWRVDMTNQDHNLYREILTRAYGTSALDDANKKVNWTANQGGYDAWQFLVDLTLKDKVSDPTLAADGPTAWLAQQAAMMVSGSFYLGTAKSKASFQWGVWPMPAGPKGSANYGSLLDQRHHHQSRQRSRQAGCLGQVPSVPGQRRDDEEMDPGHRRASRPHRADQGSDLHQ